MKYEDLVAKHGEETVKGWRSKGGKKGSSQAKSEAGKKGYQKMLESQLKKMEGKR